MQDTQLLDGTDTSSRSYWTQIVESKWTNVALIASVVALLIIGITASTGAFNNAIGTTNADYLSYGMYGGAALLLTATIAKLIHNYCFKNKDSDDSDSHFMISEGTSISLSKFGNPVPEDYVSPTIKRSEPLSPEVIGILKEKAKTYAASHAQKDPWSSLDKATVNLQSYITQVIDNAEFQKDPVAYMEAWKRARGGSHDYRIPEDTARKFFQDPDNYTNS